MDTIIYHDRRFLRCDEFIIPLVQTSIWKDPSLNTGFSQRTSSVKMWEILGYGYKRGEKILYTEKELKEFIAGPEHEGVRYKSIDKYHSDFRKWLRDGISSARTVEETVAMENCIEIIGLDALEDMQLEIVDTKTELYYVLNELKHIELIRYGSSEYSTDENVCVSFDTSTEYYILEEVGAPGFYHYSKNSQTASPMFAKKFPTMEHVRKYFLKMITEIEPDKYTYAPVLIKVKDLI